MKLIRLIVRFSMRKILTEILTSIAIFFLLTLSAHAIKLAENNSYSGTIKDNYRNFIPLPPGSWYLSEIEMEQEYVTYYFSNSDIGYVTYFGPKGSPTADVWAGRSTPSMCRDNAIAKNVNMSGKNNYEWCAFHDGEYVEFRNHTAESFSQYFHAYWIRKDLLKDVSKTKIQSLASRIFDQVKKNKNGDLSFLAELKKSSVNTSTNTTQNKYESLSNKDICIRATTLDGSGWMSLSDNDFVREAWSRDLNVNECRVLTGRKIITENIAGVKSKLLELKSLLDEGLITQDQYDKKSSEILGEF